MAHAWAAGKLYGLEFGPRFGQRLWSWPKSSFSTAGRIASGRGHRARASTARRGGLVGSELLGGDDYRQRISKLLERTQAAIVIWSRRSVDSQWVMSEAAAARERKVLVPVTIDGAEPPIDFRGLHTTDLISWVRATGFLPRCSGRSLSGLTGRSTIVTPTSSARAPWRDWRGGPLRLGMPISRACCSSSSAKASPASCSTSR